MTDIVFYYANHNRKYLAMAYQSIESLRRYNKDLRVILFTDRSAIESVRRHFQFENFSAKILTTNNENPYLNKWLCLGAIMEMGADRTLLLDVDTIFYDDAAKLFSFVDGVHLAAREEAGTNPAEKDTDIYFDKLEAARLRKQSGPCPIFNTGVMILDRVGMQMGYNCVPYILRLMIEFQNDRESFPSPNWHLIEEIPVSIYFGSLQEFRYRLLPPEQAPYFIEISTNGTRNPGILIHYWTAYASLKSPNPYADFEGSLPFSSPGGYLP